MLPELGFCRDIPSHEKKPDPGDKKFPGYPEGKKSRKISNPGDYAEIQIKLLRLKKIPNLGDKNPETQTKKSRRFSERIPRVKKP